MKSAIDTVKVVLLVAAVLAASGCLVKRKCFRDGDCPPPKICSASGSCVYECSSSGDCEEGFVCEDHRCVPEQVGPITCPDGMAAVENAFCMDRWEASRPDATGTSAGTDGSRATSRPGVLPWKAEESLPDSEVHNDDAERACEAAGKRLCTPREWEYACKGSADNTFVYGDAYDPLACNSLDTFGGEDDAKVMPTGSFTSCVDEWGVYDLCGNVYEHVAGGSDAIARGGSFESEDPMTETLRCDHVPTTYIPCYCTLGFRCCLTPGEEPEPEPEPSVEEPAEDAAGEPVDDGPDLLEEQDEAVEDAPEEDAAEEEAVSPACPAEMALVGTYCIDRWEVSREDATATSTGTLDVATSRPGVLAWNYASLAIGQAACTAAGKYLCTSAEWEAACEGGVGSTYTYGSLYDPVACTGGDTFCDCTGTACSGLTTCPYPGCYSLPSPEGGGPCGGGLHPTTTGSMPGCTNAYGVYDMSGNLWEIVDSSGVEQFRAGGYNSLDALTQHACTYYYPSGGPCSCSRGFRCCKAPE